MDELKGSGEVVIEIYLVGQQAFFREKSNTTNGAVVSSLTPDGGFELTADLGTYAFNFVAIDFTFDTPAITWDGVAPQNLAWSQPGDKEVVMSDLNFVTSEQTVTFSFNPAPEFAHLISKRIDPTVINNPDPPQALAAGDLKESVAA